jgi:hypothetical protein
MLGQPAARVRGVRRGTPNWLPLLAIAIFTVTGGSFAQDPTAVKKPHTVPRATSEVTIDGAIEEQAWEDALILELNYEVRPGENIEPPVRTVVFITYDQGNVLVAFRAYDVEPEKIRARFRDHDKIHGDDWVGIILGTFNDERRAYEFWVNPLGAQTEGIYSEGGGGGGVGRNFDDSWDAIWHSAGRLTDFGYEVEMAIPFNQIRFQGTDGPQIWGVDATRSWPRSDQVHIGLFPRERGANSYLAQEEKLIGFEGASPGRNLEFVPTVTGFALEERPDFPPSTETNQENDLEVGATATWGVTPNITLTGALNPDFSQIEADAVQLALNERFELFFEERRPFFLESADYFETGVELFYTRMIVDPLAALKLTGKMGRHTVGVISAYDEVTNLIVPGPEGSDSGAFDSPNTAFIGRYRYDLGSNSTIGAYLNDRRGLDGYFNRVAAVDALLRPTQADSISINAAWSNSRYSPEMQSELDATSEEVSGHGLAVEYVHTTRNWFAFAEYTDLGDDFRADLGFIPRVGYREANAGAGYLWWGDEGHFYNQIEVGGFAGRSEFQDGELLNQTTQAWFQFEGPLQSNVHIELGERTVVDGGVRFENLFVPVFVFRIRPSASFGLRFFAVGGDWVDFDNGRPADRTRISGRVDLNLGRHLEIELEHLYSTLDVEGGRLFTAQVPQMTASWQFNTRTFVRAILQYSDVQRDQDLYEDVVDELERDFFVQLLFSYKINPRTVFFAGYSEGSFENQDFTMTSTSRAIFLKIGYAWLW